MTPELFAARKPVPPVGLASMKAKPVTRRRPSSSPPNPAQQRDPGHRRQARPDHHLPRERRARRRERGLQPDLDADVIKVAVIERHGKNGNIGRGFVNGFGLKRGAIASSVGHDSHNITVVGANDADMALAVNRLIEMGGGFAVAEDGAGHRRTGAADRRADEPASRSKTVCDDNSHVLRDAAQALGCVLPEPFLQVAFLALPVIPHLKMTDQGAVRRRSVLFRGVGGGSARRGADDAERCMMETDTVPNPHPAIPA